MKGMVMTAEEGGADKERRASRFTKEAMSAAGRSLVVASEVISSDRSTMVLMRSLTVNAGKFPSNGRTGLDA